MFTYGGKGKGILPRLVLKIHFIHESPVLRDKSSSKCTSNAITLSTFEQRTYLDISVWELKFPAGLFLEFSFHCILVN